MTSTMFLIVKAEVGWYQDVAYGAMPTVVEDGRCDEAACCLGMLTRKEDTLSFGVAPDDGVKRLGSHRKYP